MKPKFNLNDPRVKRAIGLYNARMQLASKAPQRVESAVLPVYLTSKPSGKPEQVGSCVILEIDNTFFALSASHVFDEIGASALLVGIGFGNPLQAIAGERFSTLKGASGTHRDDPIDASAFHMQSEVHDEIKNVALSISDLDLSERDLDQSVFMAAGFRANRSYVTGSKAKSKRECFPSQELDAADYALHGLDSNVHLAIAFEDQVLIEERWQQSPTPRGISGGAILKVEGVSTSLNIEPKQPGRQVLSAITIEHKKQTSKVPGALVGTRVHIHLGLIRRYLPSLFSTAT